MFPSLEQARQQSKVGKEGKWESGGSYEARSGLLWLLAPAEVWSGRDPGHLQNGALGSKEASRVVAAMGF